MLALSRTGATWRATLELYVPITPTTAASELSLAAAWAPTSGLAASSSGASSIRQPGTLFLALAWLMARSTEFLIPVPVAVRSPDRGAMTPIFTTLVAPWAPPVPVLSFLLPPQATASSRGSTTMADHLRRRLHDPGIPDLPLGS